MKPTLRRRTPQVGTINEMESKTVQGDRERAEIQHVLRKYKQVGIIDHLQAADAMFMDVTEFTDFADLMQQRKAAENHFLTLPSKLREAFDHDVDAYLDAAHDGPTDAQAEKLRKLGLLEPLPEETPREPAPTPPAQPAEE